MESGQEPGQTGEDRHATPDTGISGTTKDVAPADQNDAYRHEPQERDSIKHTVNENETGMSVEDGSSDQTRDEGGMTEGVVSEEQAESKGSSTTKDVAPADQNDANRHEPKERDSIKNTVNENETGMSVEDGSSDQTRDEGSGMTEGVVSAEQAESKGSSTTKDVAPADQNDANRHEPQERDSIKNTDNENETGMSVEDGSSDQTRDEGGMTEGVVSAEQAESKGSGTTKDVAPADQNDANRHEPQERDSTKNTDNENETDISGEDGSSYQTHDEGGMTEGVVSAEQAESKGIHMTGVAEPAEQLDAQGEEEITEGTPAENVETGMSEEDGSFDQIRDKGSGTTKDVASADLTDSKGNDPKERDSVNNTANENKNGKSGEDGSLDQTPDKGSGTTKDVASADQTEAKGDGISQVQSKDAKKRRRLQDEINNLKKENDRLRKCESQLENNNEKNEMLATQVNTLKEQLEKSSNDDSDSSKLKEENNILRESYQALMTHVEAITYQKQEVDERLNEKSRAHSDLVSMNIELHREKQTLKNQIKNSMEEKQTLKDRLKDAKEEKQTLKDRLKDSMETIDKLKDETNKQSKSIMAQSKKIKEQELKMEKDQERHQQQLQRYEIKTKQMNGEIIRLRWFEENFQSIQTQCQQLNNKLQIAERKQIMDKEKLQSLTNQIQTLLEEKEEHLLRLSKIAGANLTLNNPHIADLSDDKRPTKLAEEFSELYDNEWTDAFEVIEVIEEKDKTTDMLLLLQRAYEICHEVSAAHIQNIKNGLCHLTFRRKDVFTKADAKSLKGAGTNTCLEGQNSEELQMKSPEVPGQNNENSESKRLSDDTQYSQQSLTENKVENLSKQRQNLNEDFNLDPSQKKTTASESEIEIYHESNAFITNGKNVHTQKTNLESKESDAFDIENFRETRNATDIKNDSKQGNRQKEDKPADQCESLVPPQTESSASVDNGDTPRQEDEETAEIVTETTTQSDSNIILTHSQQSAPFMEMEIINQEPTDLNKDISSHGGTDAEGLANQTISKEILVEGRNEQANTNQMTNTDLLEKEESSRTNGQFDTPTQENAETILDVNMTETTHTNSESIKEQSQQLVPIMTNNAPANVRKDISNHCRDEAERLSIGSNSRAKETQKNESNAQANTNQSTNIKLPENARSSVTEVQADTPTQENKETDEIVTETSTQADSDSIPTQSVPFPALETFNKEPSNSNENILTHGKDKAERLESKSISGKSKKNKSDDLANTDETTKVECFEKVYEIVFEFDSLQNDQKKTVMELRKFIEINVSDQIESNVANAIAVENRIDVEKDEIITKYIKKCVNICWSMCKHEPPVHIDFNEIQEDKKFDTNVFKPYTKSGKHIDYVVWPALYLHKDGPMLCKGVAQGR